MTKWTLHIVTFSLFVQIFLQAFTVFVFMMHRYKKLLSTVDLTKDFFFSYSYHVMRSLQKNMCDNESGQVLYETMFVWNEFLTRGIHNHLENTHWTVALVYGFFKQVTFLSWLIDCNSILFNIISDNLNNFHSDFLIERYFDG